VQLRICQENANYLWQRWLIFFIVLVILFIVLIPTSDNLHAENKGHENKGNLVVFAAISMINALENLAEQFSRSEGIKVVTVFASSSRLAKQIQFGAPAHVFISANVKWMDSLLDKGLIEKNSLVKVVSNKLVLIKPFHELDYAENHENNIIEFLPDKKIIYLDSETNIFEMLGEKRLAIGNPDYVPAGMYALEALKKLGLWHEVANKIAPMPNVRSVLSVVERGEAPIGIVYNSDAKTSNKIKVIGEISHNDHQTIIYPGAVTSDAPPIAHKFLKYLLGYEAQAIFSKNGFIICSNNSSEVLELKC
tara:strand:- start:13898 stop:14818 length:921 start_codon:yes stop_codon:yes gene_type:complete